jgi:hypothetical protein
MVQNIRKSEFVMELATNGGVHKIRQKADLPGWGEVWFHDKVITNILSYAEMVEKHRITYDSANEDAFVAHLSKDKTVRAFQAFRQQPLCVQTFHWRKSRTPTSE